MGAAEVGGGFDGCGGQNAKRDVDVVVLAVSARRNRSSALRVEKPPVLLAAIPERQQAPSFSSVFRSHA